MALAGSISDNDDDGDHDECGDHRKERDREISIGALRVGRAEHQLGWRLHFANEPADISGFRRIRRDRNFFDVIAFGAVEGAQFKSCGARQDMRERQAGSAFRAAELFNCEQWDCGQVIGHCIPPLYARRERETLFRR